MSLPAVKPVALGSVRSGRHHLQIPGDMKPARSFAAQRVDVIDLVRDARLSGEPRGLAIKGTDCLHVYPRGRSDLDVILTGARAAVVVTLVAVVVGTPNGLPALIIFCAPRGVNLPNQFGVLAVVARVDAALLLGIFQAIATASCGATGEAVPVGCQPLTDMARAARLTRRVADLSGRQGSQPELASSHLTPSLKVPAGRAVFYSEFVGEDHPKNLAFVRDSSKRGAPA